MGDGSKTSAGAKIATNAFKKQDLERIQCTLKKMYNLDITIQEQAGAAENKEQYILYIPKKSMSLFSNLIKKYLVPSMYYKLSASGNGF
jgi:hypothetical protein